MNDENYDDESWSLNGLMLVLTSMLLVLLLSVVFFRLGCLVLLAAVSLVFSCFVFIVTFLIHESQMINTPTRTVRVSMKVMVIMIIFTHITRDTESGLTSNFLNWKVNVESFGMAPIIVRCSATKLKLHHLHLLNWVEDGVTH